LNGLLQQVAQQIQLQQQAQQQLLTNSDTRITAGGFVGINDPAGGVLSQQPSIGEHSMENEHSTAENGEGSQLTVSQSQSLADNVVGIAMDGRVGGIAGMGGSYPFPNGISGQLYYYYEMYQILEQSEVYLSNQNNKLFLSIPMDEFVFTFINNQQQFGMNESSINSLFSPESSNVLLSERQTTENSGEEGGMMILPPKHQEQQDNDQRSVASSIESK
jgi:hypothetical protein